ncbi:hypothetical protein [Crenobacter caeni]|uniref:Uncharacterized protein n=1 Tax=Crenobacter caeni TaxID=2705474 RepID=A0A6B2KPD6_9NEIS|nr:hypothetical protein [Crenobacter caeni]NDV11657.1 hypothetical protein [Crenobacter caeni]
MTAPWRTDGLAGQVIDGPCCYLAHWDLSFWQTVRRIAAMPQLAARRAALAEIEATQGKAARARMERALKASWKEARKTS